MRGRERQKARTMQSCLAAKGRHVDHEIVEQITAQCLVIGDKNVRRVRPAARGIGLAQYEHRGAAPMRRQHHLEIERQRDIWTIAR
jgi:hypothetical protein